MTTVPAMMIFVNFAAVCALGWLGASAARRSGHHALIGLLLPFYPGFLLSLSRDLTEVLAGALLVAFALALRVRRLWSAALLGVMALLARETTLVLAAASALTRGYRVVVHGRLLNSRSLLPLLLPLAAYPIWHLVLFWSWGVFPLHQAPSNFGSPLEGISGYAFNLASNPPRSAPLLWAQLALLLGTGLLGALTLRRSAAPMHEKVAWIIYAAALLMFNRTVWVDDWAFMRLATEFYLLGVLIFLAAGRKHLAWLALTACANVWAVLAWSIVVNRR